MAQQKIEIGSTREVIIESVSGSLQIKGWDRPEVLLKSSATDSPITEQKEDSIHIRCQGDCILRVPHEINLRIVSVQGNARIKLVEGTLHIERIQGSLALRNVGSTQATVVQGNLLARQVVGDLHIDQVFGNTVVRDVEGECTIDQVHGNLDLRDAENNIDISTSGNARIRLCMLVGQEYKIEAGGNLYCHIPEDASLKAELESQTSEISVKLPEDQRTIRENSYNLSMGGGEAFMSLSAGGKLALVTQEPERVEMDDIEAELEGAFTGISEEFTQQINEQIEAQIESQLELLDSHLDELSETLATAGYSQAEVERIIHRAQEESQKAAASAQDKMRRAQEKMERKLAAAQRKAELKARAAERRKQSQRQRYWSFEWSSSPSTSVTRGAGERSSDEERLMVLRMLEQKKITLEDAEKLLTALEGD